MKTIKYLSHLFLLKLYRNYKKIIQKFYSSYYTFKVKLICKSYISVKANAKTVVTKNTVLGQNVNFNGMIISGGGKLVIGNNFHSGTECMIITQNHNYESTKIPYDSSVICKKVVIEDNVWVGNRVLILPGVRIGEGAILQAGSVVVKDVPKYAIAGGSPAKVFSQRDKEHYERLKSEGRFH